MALLIIDKNMNSELRFPADNIYERIMYNTLNAVKTYDMSSGGTIPPIPRLVSDDITTVEAFTDSGYPIPLTNTYNKIVTLSSHIDDIAGVITYNIDLSYQ